MKTTQARQEKPARANKVSYRTGEEMHYSVGAIIARRDEYLLIDRVKPPYGFAGIAGHVEEGESPEEAVRREVWEESGLEVTTLRLVAEGRLENNICSRGVRTHYWHVYACETKGELVFNAAETKSLGWHARDAIAALPLEPAWRHWFERTGVIPDEQGESLGSKESKRESGQSAYLPPGTVHHQILKGYFTSRE